jgi:hypothetical protein
MASVTLPSGEFDPGVGDRPQPGGTAVFNNQLWLVGCGDGSGRMYQTTFDLALLSNTDGLTDQKNWVSTGLSVPKGASTFARCSLVSGLTDLYLFWNQTAFGESGELSCSAYSLSSSPPAWGTRVQMQDDAGNPVKPLCVWDPLPVANTISDVGATVFGQDAEGNDVVILGCIVGSSAGHSELYLATYNSAQIDTTASVWPAQSSTTISAPEIWPSFPDLDNVGTTLTLGCFPTASVDSSGLPILSLVACVQFPVPGEKGTVLNSFGMVLPIAADGTIGTVPSTGGYLLNGEPTVPMCCLRDPAGRLQAYWPTPGQSISTRTYVLGQANPNNPNMPTSSPDEVLAAKSADSVPMSVAFFVDTADSTSVPTDIGYTTSAPIYIFMFYGSRVKCQVQQFGIANTLSPQAIYQTKTELNVVMGIIDGPIPTPNQNTVGASTVGDLGMVVYSSNATEEVTHQTSSAWTVGIQDTFQTTKGVGPAWNVSLNSGAGSVAGGTTATVDSSAQTLPVLLDASQSVLPYATAFCYGVEFVVTGYQILTPDGAPISDPTRGSDSAPQMVVIATNLIDPVPETYIPFSVTPGDLSSYTPQSWNGRMNDLGYFGDNYFDDVIVANAYTFDSGDKFIPMSWGMGSTDTVNYLATKSTFTEKSWTFNSSVYGGVSIGGGFALFGMGEEAAGTFLAGMTFTAQAETSDTSSNQWGIAVLPDNFGPPVRPEVVGAAMAHYAFRLYFLPVPSPPLPPTYWADELISHLPKDGPASYLDPATIDPSSAPWRIVFVVTEYTSNDGNTKYEYDGSLG